MESIDICKIDKKTFQAFRVNINLVHGFTFQLAINTC